MKSKAPSEQPSRDFFKPAVAGGGSDAKKAEFFLLILAALALGWWWGPRIPVDFRSKWTEVTALVNSKWPGSPFQEASKPPRDVPKPQVASKAPSVPVAELSAKPVKPRIARRSTLRAFMQEELKLTPTQMGQYEKYRRYYSDRIQSADRIENRNRSAEVAKLAIERERLLTALLGQRGLDSIRWWANGTKSRISLNEWLRKTEAQRQKNALQRGIASH